MTNEELAKHWGVSLAEVKRISDFMNKNFYLALGQNKETKLWHGVMYKMHESPSGNRTPHLWVSSKDGFTTQRAATEHMNTCVDTMTCKSNPILMDVPVDAYKAIRKLELSAVIPNKTRLHRVFPERHPER